MSCFPPDKIGILEKQFTIPDLASMWQIMKNLNHCSQFQTITLFNIQHYWLSSEPSRPRQQAKPASALTALFFVLCSALYEGVETLASLQRSLATWTFDSASSMISLSWGARLVANYWCVPQTYQNSEVFRVWECHWFVAWFGLATSVYPLGEVVFPTENGGWHTWEAETCDLVETEPTLCASTLLNSHVQATLTKVVVLDDKKAQKCQFVIVRRMKTMNLKQWLAHLFVVFSRLQWHVAFLCLN